MVLYHLTSVISVLFSSKCYQICIISIDLAISIRYMIRCKKKKKNSNCSTAMWLSHLFSGGWTISWPGSVLWAPSSDWTSYWATAPRCPLRTDAPLLMPCSDLPVCLRLHWPRGHLWPGRGSQRGFKSPVSNAWTFKTPSL